MSRRSKLVILAGIVLAAALATAAVAIMSWPGDESATPTRAAMPVVKRPSLPAPRPLPRETMTIAVPADTGLGRLTAAHDAVWAAGERGLYRIDPRRNEFTRHVALADAWSVGVAVTDGDVWSGQYDGDLISRIDSITGRVVAQIRVPEPQGIAVSSAAVWVSNHHDGTVSRIDPRTNSVAATIKLSRQGQSGPQTVAAASGSVWVGVPNVSAIFRIDARTNEVLAIVDTPQIIPCGGIAASETAVWATSCEVTQFARIEPTANRVALVVDLGVPTGEPVLVNDTVWFGINEGDPENTPADAERSRGYLVGLNSDGTVGARFRLGRGFFASGAVVASGSLWLADGVHGRVLRIPLAAID